MDPIILIGLGAIIVAAALGWTAGTALIRAGWRLYVDRQPNGVMVTLSQSAVDKQP
jgi:hypothetical protein